MMRSQRILLALSAPLDLVPAPYGAVARKLGLSEEQLLQRLRTYRRKGVMKRVAIMFAHQKVGYTHNALVVWKAGSRCDAVGEMFARLEAVSHCYARRPQARWPYDLYTMVHATSRQALEAAIKGMARRSGIEDHRVLPTVREFKKTRSDLREVLR